MHTQHTVKVHAWIHHASKESFVLAQRPRAGTLASQANAVSNISPDRELGGSDGGESTRYDLRTESLLSDANQLTT